MKVFSKIDSVAFSKFERVVGKSADDTTRNLYSIFRVAIFSSMAIFLINVILRLDFVGVSNWKLGEFGDFFGGVLNPILTFLMFIGLIITIVVQKSELSLARDDLPRLRAHSESKAIPLKNKH